MSGLKPRPTWKQRQRQTQRQKQIPSGNGKRKARARTTAKAKSQYGDLSTAAAKCAASGRDDGVWGEVGRATADADSLREWKLEEQKQLQRQMQRQKQIPSGMETRRAKATADSCGMENKRSKSNCKSKKPIQGSLHCGGKVQVLRLRSGSR